MFRKRKSYFLVFILLCTLSPVAQAQNGHRLIIDSLENELLKTGVDSSRMNFLNGLGYQYWKSDSYDTALYYAQTALQLAQDLDLKKGESKAYSIIGITYFDMGRYTDALDNYYLSLNICELLGDSGGIAVGYSNIGNVFRRQKAYDQAIEWHLKALSIREKLGDKRNMAVSYFNIANVYGHTKDYDNAITYYEMVVEIGKELNKLDLLSHAYNNIGNLYKRTGNLNLAMKYHQNSLEIVKTQGAMNGLAYSYYNIGEIYNLSNKPKEAKYWLSESMQIAKERNIQEIIKANYAGLAVADSLMGNYLGAYHNFKLYIALRDSLFNEEKIREVTKLSMEYEFEKKEAVEKVKHENALFQARVQWGSLTIFVFVLALVGFTLLYVTRLKKEKEHHLFLTQQEVTRLEKEKVDEDLAQAKTDLQQFLRQIEDKNRIIEKVNEELNALRDSQNQMGDGLKSTLSELKRQNILTNDDWLHFLRSFNKLYPKFSIRIKELQPKITESELRYLMLTKIGLEHKEMASALGVTTDTIRVTWNRTRIKLGGSIKDAPQSLLNRMGVA